MLSVVGVAGAIVLVVLGDDPAAVRSVVARMGLWGPIAYVALSIVLTVALFPYPPQAAAAGLLFGVAEGTVCAIIGGALGAMAAFGIARRFGRTSIDDIAGRRLRWLLDEVAGRGFTGVLLVRVMPGVPRQPASYLCGLTPVGWRPFAAANLVGIAPYAYAYVTLGGTLGEFGSTQSLVAVGLLLVFALLGLALFMWERRRARGEPQHGRDVQGEQSGAGDGAVIRQPGA